MNICCKRGLAGDYSEACVGMRVDGGFVNVQVPDGKVPQKKLKAPSMSRHHGIHLNSKPDVVVEADEEVSCRSPVISRVNASSLPCHDDRMPGQEANIAPSNASTNSANRGAEGTLTRTSPFAGDDYIVGIITIEVRLCSMGQIVLQRAGE